MIHHRSHLYSRQPEVLEGSICAECGIYFTDANGYKAVCNDCAAWRIRKHKPAIRISCYNIVASSSCRVRNWGRSKFKEGDFNTIAT